MASILRRPWKEQRKRSPSALLSLERQRELKEQKKQQTEANNARKLEVRGIKKQYYDAQRQREAEKADKKKKLKMLAKGK